MCHGEQELTHRNLGRIITRKKGRTTTQSILASIALEKSETVIDYHVSRSGNQDNGYSYLHEQVVVVVCDYKTGQLLVPWDYKNIHKRCATTIPCLDDGLT